MARRVITACIIGKVNFSASDKTLICLAVWNIRDKVRRIGVMSYALTLAMCRFLCFRTQIKRQLASNFSPVCSLADAWINLSTLLFLRGCTTVTGLHHHHLHTESQYNQSLFHAFTHPDEQHEVSQSPQFSALYLILIMSFYFTSFLF